MRNGGYSILDLSVTDNLYTSAVKAVNTEKPILVYGDDVPYFADSVTADSDAVVITKGGQIISISNANAITKTGDKDGALLSSIVDANGNARFVEGDGELADDTGITVSYNKWSLSGTHLMVVLAGTIADETALTSNQLLTTYTIPEYIGEKIYEVLYNIIEVKGVNTYASDYTTQSVPIHFRKVSDTSLILRVGSDITLTAERTFRVQFDLLIDTD